MTHDALARKLQDALALKMAPIAVCFASTPPDGVPAFEGSAPGGCSFWQTAADGAFSTTTKDHELCAIGVHTHALPGASESTGQQLGEVLKVMADMTYVRPEDVARIPVLQDPKPHVVYAPLGGTPLDPDVVLLFADGRQGLVISEAVDQVDGDTPPALGRPACAVVPQAMNTQRAALSLGCCGARAYLDALTDDVALWALPGAKLQAYVERIVALTSANDTLAKFHALRRADIEAGKKPTVAESLERLQASS